MKQIEIPGVGPDPAIDVDNGKSAQGVVASPSLFDFPRADRRLVDAGLAFYEASLAGKAERYTRGETPHTVHVWWARRPHSAMRALVYASLSKNLSAENAALLTELGAQPVPDRTLLVKARDALRAEYGRAPRVLDMFGGGGTIPLEAALLGCESSSVDVNELSVFLQRANLTLHPAMNKVEVAGLLKRHGTAVLDRLANRTEALYPLRRELAGSGDQAIAYIWSYLQPCQGCGYKFSLSKRPWLSKKSGRSLAQRLWMGELKDDFSIETIESTEEANLRWQKRGPVTCPRCGTRHDKVNINDCEDIVTSVVTTTGKGKSFRIVQGAVPPLGELEVMERDILARTGLNLPVTELPVWSGIVNPALYGFRTHADLFNRRQRITTLMLIEELTAEHREIERQQGVEVARFVTGALSGLVDQMVDWNCRLSMWIPQNEQVGRAFCGPGVAMLWDYAEVDPSGTGPANLRGKLDRICAGVTVLGMLERSVDVRHASATALPFESGTFDAIVTDPPYYDNIFYSVLADFFHSWKKPLIDLVNATTAQQAALPTANSGHDELVASTFRSGSKTAAHEQYCKKLMQAIQEAARVLRDDGLMSFVYSHASLLGWAAMVEAFRPSPFVITSVQPLSIERKARPRAITSEAVNTCISFVARKGQQAKEGVTQEDFFHAFDLVINAGFHQSLLESGWHELDVGVAVFANGVAMLANYAFVQGATTEQVLKKVAAEIQKVIPAFSVTQRGSL